MYVIRKLADANAIREKLDSVTDIAVIGGGVLGLEAAWEFRRGKKNVTIIEVSDGLMKNQLDAHASQILREAAENSGIKVITNAKIDQITESGEIWQTHKSPRPACYYFRGRASERGSRNRGGN